MYRHLAVRGGGIVGAALLIAQVSQVWSSHALLAADELPRYRLKVGQELVYRTTDPPREYETGAGAKVSQQTTYQWTIDVVSQDSEENWWIVFRESITRISSYGGKHDRQELETDGHFLLSPEGQLIENATIKPMSNPTALFPALPATATELLQGWTSQMELDDTKRVFQTTSDAKADGNPHWRFTERPQAALDPIYESSAERHYEFDREAGVVRKHTTTYRQGWPASSSKEATVQTCELAEIRQLDPQVAAKLAAEARGYFDSVDKVDRLVRQAAEDLSRTSRSYLEAAKVLKDAAQALTVPTLRALADARMKQLRRDAQSAMQDAMEFGRLIDRPSPDWQTKDLDGQPRALTDYRGKVLVLDFWYRGCGWCVRAMPQMKQLTEDFAGQDVAIVGVNSDSELDDARFVIDRLKLNYPTIRNGEDAAAISPKYKIHGWPTLVIIDKQGIVRHIHFGYTPTLRDDLAGRIRKLLDKPAS